MNLPRVLEAEVMASREEALDYDSMDHTGVNRRFVDDLLATGRVAGDVLDLGTGTAQIPVELCQQALDCRVMAIDLSIEMLELARYNVETGDVRERVFLHHVDAKQLPYPDAHFDLIISNSIVHHIAEPRAVLREAVRVATPGGRLFFRDLLRPESEARLEELVACYAGQDNPHQQQMFADSLRAALTLDEIRAVVGELGFAEQSVQATSDRHWTWNAEKEPPCDRTST